jgi:hypothetical protein
MSLEAIYLAGDDALQNQFQVVIPPFAGGTDIAGINLRVTNFSCPDLTVGVYSVEYKGGTFEKPNGKNASSKEFTFDFRVDKYWRTYASFVALKQLVQNDLTDTVGIDVAVGGISATRFPVSVLTLDGNDLPTSSGWQYNFCFIKSLTGISHDYSGGDPLTATVTMGFVNQKVLI